MTSRNTLEEWVLSEDSVKIRYARRVALKIRPDQVENFLAKMRSVVFPNLKNQKGIRRMYLLRTPGEYDFVSLTFWDDKSYADAYGASEEYAKNTESVREFLESDPSLTQFDVDLHDVSEELPPPKVAVRRAPVIRRERRSKTKKKSKRRKSR